MSDPETLSEQIAASNEDVKALLKDNRSLSVAFLAVRLQEHEEEVRKRFLEYRRVEAKLKDVEESLEKMSQRLDVFAVKWREMREELDQLKADQPKSEPNAAPEQNGP